MSPLRVLVLHSRYLSGALSGENRVVADEVELLRAAGHEVEVVSPSPDAVPRRELARRLLAPRGARGLRDVIERNGVDVVHFHNLFPAVGPGALTAAAKAGAAVVVTLHSYRLMCLAGTLRRNGHACRVCVGHVPWRGVVHRCYRGSAAQSLVLAGSLTEHRRTGAFDSVHRFLAVSDFVRDRHLEAGLPADRIAVKPNVVPAAVRREGPGASFVVLGRLSSEKGVAGLVRAWRPELGELVVIGDGPERREIDALAAERGVTVRDPVAPEEVPAILAGARAVLLPSLSYEGQPRVVLEAYAAGVPVIAHRIGALPELVQEGVTGVLVPPQDVAGWYGAARRLADDAVSIELGDGAYRVWAERFSPERGLAALETAYAEALAAR